MSCTTRDRRTWAGFCRYGNCDDIIDRAHLCASMFEQGEIKNPITSLQNWLNESYPETAARMYAAFEPEPDAPDRDQELAAEEYDGKIIVFTVRGNFSSAKIGATLMLTNLDADGNVRRSEECPVVFEERYDYPYVENPFTDGVDWHGGTVRGENDQVVGSVPWQE